VVVAGLGSERATCFHLIKIAGPPKESHSTNGLPQRSVGIVRFYLWIPCVYGRQIDDGLCRVRDVAVVFDRRLQRKIGSIQRIEDNDDILLDALYERRPACKVISL
jgi:hypothetical protein